MKGFVVFFLAFGSLVASAAPEAHTVFRLFTSEAALQGVMPAIGTKRTKVDEHLAAKVISGIAYTTGTSRLDLLPSDADAKLRILLDFTTMTRTTTETTPRPDIKVSVFTTAVTQTSVTKLISLKPDHIEASPAEATARTAITIHGVSARATGSFSGEKKKQAEAQGVQVVRGQIPDKEVSTSARLEKEIKTMVDDKATEMVASLNRDYKDIFFIPLFVDGRIPGTLRYYSTEEGFRLAVDSPANREWEAVSALPALDEGAVFGANIHQSLFNVKMADRIAGKVYDEGELEGFLKREGLKTLERHDWGTVAERVYVRFCDANPLQLTFANDAVEVTLCAKAVKNRGVWGAGASLALRYTLTRPKPGQLVLKRSDVRIEGAPLPPDSARFLSRYGSLFPAEIMLGDLPIPSASEAMKDVILSHASVTDGWFNMTWKSKETP